MAERLGSVGVRCIVDHSTEESEEASARQHNLDAMRQDMLASFPEVAEAEHPARAMLRLSEAAAADSRWEAAFNELFSAQSSAQQFVRLWQSKLVIGDRAGCAGSIHETGLRPRAARAARGWTAARTVPSGATAPQPQRGGCL